MTLDRVTINGNTADKDGGGIYNFGVGSTLSLVNVTISGNSATDRGGGLFSNRASDGRPTPRSPSTPRPMAPAFTGRAGTARSPLRTPYLTIRRAFNANTAMTSLGYNIDSDGSAGLTDPTDIEQRRSTA